MFIIVDVYYQWTYMQKPYSYFVIFFSFCLHEYDHTIQLQQNPEYINKRKHNGFIIRKRILLYGQEYEQIVMQN